MAGPEQNLVEELRACALGQAPATSTWRNTPQVKPAVLRSQGSGNWPVLAAAIRHTVLGDNRDALMAYLTASQDLWMGMEEWSTIYGGFFLMSIALVLRQATASQDDELAAAARDWGAFWFGLAKACSAPDGATPDASVLTVGMRSGGRAPAGAIVWTGWMVGLATGASTASWEARGRVLHLAMRNSWVYATAQALRDALGQMAAAPMPAYALAQPIHVCTWGDGSSTNFKLVYLEAHQPGAGNGNTTPLMAAAWDGAKVDPQTWDAPLSFLPADGGQHIRQKFERVTMERTPGDLTYTSDLEGVQHLALPDGEPDEVVIGRPAEV